MWMKSRHHSDGNGSSLASVLQLLVDAGFLGAVEVGKLTQSSSKELNREELEDSILWAFFVSASMGQY
jgi:hypothetical protein